MEKNQPRRPDIVAVTQLVIKAHAAGGEGEQQVKAIGDDGKLHLTTLASTPEIDEMNEIVEPEAFVSSIKSFGEVPIMLAYHDMKQPCGRWDEQKIDKRGLTLSGFISGGRPDIQQLVLDGVVAHTSIGFYVKDQEWDDTLQVMRIKDLELVEVSLVPVPANRGTYIELGSALKDWQRKATNEHKARQEPEPEEEAAPTPPQAGPSIDLGELVARAFTHTTAGDTSEGEKQ